MIPLYKCRQGLTLNEAANTYQAGISHATTSIEESCSCTERDS